MINTVWQGFSRFHVAFVIKRLLYIEFKVFRKKRKRAGDVGKAQRGYCLLVGLGNLCRDKGSGYVLRHGALFRDMVPRLQAGVGSRQGFSWSRQSCFLLFFCHDKGPHGVTTVFFFFFIVTMS